MQLDLPQQGERDWYKKFTKALNDAAGMISLDASTRNYTLTNGATKSTDSPMYLWREKSYYMDRIYGVGNIKIPALQAGQNFGIVMPFDIYAGDFITGDVFTYDFKPYFGIDHNNGQILIYVDTATQAKDYWFKFEAAHYKG